MQHDLPTLDTWFQRIHEFPQGVIVAAPAPTYPRGLTVPEPDEELMATDGRPSHQYKARVAAKAGRPLRLPVKPPPCFPTRQKEWDQYRATCNYTADKSFTFCRDCTPERKAEMIKQDRCQYPKTIFVVSYGVLVGRRRSGRGTK